MNPPRTLTIVTAAPHHEWEGRLWSHTPYVREIDLWTHLFDRVIIVGPAERTRPPGDCIPFESDQIELRGVPPTGGDHVRDKALQLFALPLLVWRVARAARAADATHVRCPGNLGLLGVLLVPALSRRMVAKYAGQWTGFPGEKWTVRLQRAILRSRWWRGPVTVYGDWPEQPRHVIPFFTSVLSDAQIERAGRTDRPPRREGALEVLYVGRLSGPKHVDAVIRATGVARRRGVDVRCTVVGDGAERDHLEALARDEAVAPHVHFAGAVGLDEVLERYEQADTLVLVSQSEGWPKAVAEAMTFGLVCIGSDRGMVPQMLGDGRGVVVPPGDHMALADALCDLAAAPEAADEMAAKAAVWGRQHSVEQLEVAIAELLTRWWGAPVGAPPRISVLHVTDTLAAGGAERVALNLANGMDRARYRLALCTTRRGGILAAEAAADVDRLSLDRTTRSRDPAAVLRLARYLRREHIDVVHAHGTSLFISAAACTLAPRAQLVWHDHFGANVASGRWRRLQYRLAASRAAHVITVNHALEGWAVAALGIPQERVTTVPNFVVDRTVDHALADLPGDDGRRVVCVANLRRDKDHVGFVEAMARVIERVPDAHGLIVGSPTDPEVVRRVEARIEALGLGDRVTLLGRRTDVDEILANCTVGVLTSRSEGFPLALLEYGRRSLPSVATAVGECPEILDHGAGGRLVPPGDPDAVAAEVIYLLTHPNEAAALGQRFRRRVEEHYGATEVMARVERVYTSVTGRGPRRAVEP